VATISESEAIIRFDELLDRVQEGEEVVITRHEKPVARLIAEGKRNLADIRQAAEGLEALQKEIAESGKVKGRLTWKAFKSAVGGGRN
jgi:prevent-host-death family protein